MRAVQKLGLALVVVVAFGGASIRADEVVGWNQMMFRAALVAGTTPLVMSRVSAIVQTAVFDAVNGIENRYTQIHVPRDPVATAGASREAAAVQGILFATPAHPEYPSGHSCLSGAAGAVLADFFGEKTRFSAGSDAMPCVTRSFKSFSSALEEVKNARIFSGIHFRAATEDGQALGVSVAQYVLENAAKPVHH